MTHIRTFAELEALPPTPAEWKLINAAKAGERCKVGPHNATPPVNDASHDFKIRADVLRYLLLGGCEAHPVDDAGVWVVGAQIVDTLKVDFTVIPGAIQLINCRFDAKPSFYQAQCGAVALNGSILPGLRAQGMTTTGSVFLKNIISTDCIDLKSARIGGQLVCISAHVNAPNGFAINAQGAEVNGGVFLHPRTSREQKTIKRQFKTDAGISLSGAKIGGLYAEHTIINSTLENDAIKATNLRVNGNAKLGYSTVRGEVRLTGAKITGELNCEGADFSNATGHAFNGQRMRIDQSFIWQKVANAEGEVSLNGAHVAELNDDPENWPDAGRLLLDGFTYDRIRGKVSTSPARKEWLLNGSLYKDQFFPQPYTQYANFLRDTGHDAQARQVLLTREIKVREYERRELGGLLRLWRGFWDRLQEWVVGHGHAPFRSATWLCALILLAIIPAHLAWEEGSFAPNASPILVSDGWQDVQSSAQNPAKIWSGELAPDRWSETRPDTPWQPLAPGRDWETFNRYAYAADIVIPLINFGQTEAWAPSTTREAWGWHLWWLRWVFTVFGWIVTALGAAAITGIIRRD